ncbi:thiamine biosynthesis protein ThiI [Metamycoplasma arthritidis]|uniref:Probable tRNA sulfurtransferase n=1 Tax=Metamycoplasma arthritidis (strain 158L3-1) TaxID=243272 RepID=THII_META1|nr:tRNA uracil 4-sulfurtransferase ThiI [Metamycoplasma arthritidis]B3PLZ2.1 RecName: Full=Probable tRNA sulfurtransferase; AltName: Full=Sulfur carrier protein ThiS sulfurtransferase; AltName: Full=Thiamine biosynthesis protein ThiI; AltName: Full=tRNA 4-thiouridine synthase [Metamycoplasma arthritidis 158L3-1]ACF07044.1 thiamine biosynthesis protein [Metamycoplasma arthritidis 158L3-1]VEU78573.1 thiamine biosynthesis protein ThiI [Metamycoplasma arthritidis]
MYQKILIRYGELTLKGQNKRDFINDLKRNLMFHIPKEQIKMEYDRAFLDFSLTNLDALKYVFGISSYSCVYEVESSLAAITSKVLDIAKQKYPFKTFAIAARRHNKNFEMNSNDLNRHLGCAILSNFEVKVNLEEPDLKIYVEVRDASTYIFIDYIAGLGGMPLNSAGQVLHLMSGGIDSPVAAYLLQKRGLRINFLNFITPPHTDEKTTQKVDELIKVIAKYQGSAKLYQVNFTDIMNYIGLVSNQKYKIILMRRSFYRIAQMLAKKLHIKALSNGENLAQVASQTLEAIHTVSAPITLPIFRPLLSFDKNETIKIAEKIGTMPISILKACETCELFAPKNPIIKPTPEEASELEKELDKLPELEKLAVENVTIKTISTL